MKKGRENRVRHGHGWGFVRGFGIVLFRFSFVLDVEFDCVAGDLWYGSADLL